MARGRRSPRPDRGGGRASGSERLDGSHVVLEALRAGRRRLDRLWLAEGRGSDRDVLLAAAREAGVPVDQGAPDGMQPAKGARAVLEAGPLPESSLEELLAVDGGDRRIVVLDGVEDPQNLGALARVAEATGAVGIVTGRRRSAPLSPAASRASAGALEWLPVARVGNLRRAVDSLKQDGFWLVGADPRAERGLFEVPQDLLQGDLGIVLGGEGRGLRPSMVDALDHRVRIPMVGRVSSLNVSTAGAVLLYELLRRTASVAEVPVGAKESR